MYRETIKCQINWFEFKLGSYLIKLGKKDKISNVDAVNLKTIFKMVFFGIEQSRLIIGQTDKYGLAHRMRISLAWRNWNF